VGLLTSANYDPATAVSKATSALLAMTALDTTNLRVSFNAPTSGAVLVRMQGVLHGSSTVPQILMGILEGSTVVRRVAPSVQTGSLTSTSMQAVEALFVVAGLSPGAPYVWDAAYGVETAVSSTGLKYGGPNNTTGNDAFGAFLFEVYEA
jgi:hypothetical protein